MERSNTIIGPRGEQLPVPEGCPQFRNDGAWWFGGESGRLECKWIHLEQIPLWPAADVLSVWPIVAGVAVAWFKYEGDTGAVEAWERSLHRIWNIRNQAPSEGKAEG